MRLLMLWNAVRSRIWSLEDRTSLRHQIALATSVLCFVLVSVLAIGAAYVGRSEAIAHATEDLNRIAGLFAGRLDRGIDNRLAIVRHMAALAPLNAIWEGDPRVARALLAETRDSLTDTAWIGFVTPDGVIRAAAGGAFEGQSVAHHAWFKRGLLRPVVVDSTTEGARAASERMPVFADTVIQRFVEIGVPVRNESGRLLGVLGFYFSRNWANELRSSTIADADREESIRIELLHEDGQVVLDHGAHTASYSPAALRAMVASGDGVLPGDSEEGHLSAYAVSSGTSRPVWIAIARQPVSTALASADRVVATIVFLGLIVGLAGILGALAIAGRVSAPFQKLADKAALVGRETSATMPRVRGSFEAARLSTVLRALVLRLSYAEKSTAEADARAADAARRLNSDIAKLRNLADADTLTELLNRRAFMEVGRRAVEEWRRSRRSFALLMIDIDNFKNVNDGYGHSTGDLVIRWVGRAITGMLRPSDRGARFGGEEFVTLLRDVTAEDAKIIAERLRTSVASTPITVGMHDLSVTVSIGVAAFEAGDRDIQALIERADVALYTAKGGGRNRVVMALPAVPERQIA